MRTIPESVTEWLDAAAARFPDKTALHDESGNLTYKEYRTEALALAREIIQRNLKQSPVAVYLDKGIHVLTSFFGIAYSRNCYSPVDTALPAARISRMLSILQPKAAITKRSLAPAFSSAGFTGEYIFLEDIVPDADDEKIVSELKTAYNREDLLYILFTSGSTGIPKGVSITHRSVLNYIEWACKTFAFTEADSFANQAPFYFDNSILDIYCAAKSGAELFITPANLFAQPVPLLNYLKTHQITTIFWVPSALVGPAKLKAFRNVDVSASLKRVLFCGEVMSVRQLNIWRAFLPDALYANLYGPTEITDACTYYIVNRDFPDTEPLPIGKPIDNVEILLLNEGDDGLCKAAGGEAGEICVSGVCLSAGYYNNPEKTAEVFVEYPKGSGRTIYKTGDLARLNSDGDLIYLSRKDFQIKHLGHRIELGEIEAAADSVPGVTVSCVLYDNVKHKLFLFAETDISAEKCSEQLKQLLPEYMLPSKIIIMDKIPINCNGKIDRTSLKEYMK
ncbi:MAG TPA: amino acid adenylation domain-containing protein [Methanocorpusculum sp.]|nr:amino acid adenylation domain-containing protein [Methanocorpusculum sp.]